jgi:phage tail sheath protein FI
MPSIRLPGVYTREIPGSLRPIVGAGTDTLGMAGDRFGIFSVAGGQRDAAAISEPHPPSTMGAVYWPWIQPRHSSDNTMITIPPVGHVAGIFAQTNTTRGVHIAPANVVVQGAFDLEFSVTAEDHDLLNPRGVNVIRDFRCSNRGIRLWGARTMSSDPEWKYVSVRRLAIYLRESIDKGTRWAVFEPNAPALWDSIGKSIENFLQSVWRDGALQGAKPEQAFFVRCDRTTMTQNDIDSGRLICEVGIAPVKPAEFVLLRIPQKTADSR